MLPTPSVHQFLKFSAFDSAARGHNADVAIERQGSSGLDSRLYANNGELGKGSTHLLHRLCSGGVASHHDGFDAMLLHQKARNGNTTRLNSLSTAFAVRCPSRVGKVHHIFFGQNTQQLPQHAQTAHTAVKNTDGGVVRCAF